MNLDMEKTFYTKEETLAFIGFLRKKENVTIDDQFIPHHSFFGTSFFNTYGRAKMILELIRQANSTIHAYGAIAALQGKQNCLWKTFPQGTYMFREDWEEYRKSIPEPIPDNIAKWEKKAIPLFSSRSFVFDLFPTEYLLFIHRYETAEEQQLTVTQVPLKGTYNGYRYQKAKIENSENSLNALHSPVKKTISLSFSSTSSGIETEEGIRMAKFLCTACNLDQVRIFDLDDEKAIVVRKEPV